MIRSVILIIGLIHVSRGGGGGAVMQDQLDETPLPKFDGCLIFGYER